MKRTAEDIALNLKIKRDMRKQIREAKAAMNEESKFVSAFTDVFKAMRLAAMDVGNSLRLVLGMVLTFDPNKLNDKIKAFDERRQRINAEWAPILARSKEAIRNADPILMMAIMGPANFLGAQGIAASLVAGKTAAEALTATNWDSLINSFTTTLNVNQNLQKFFANVSSSEALKQQKDDESLGMQRQNNRTLRRLARIFSEGGYASGLAESFRTSKSLIEQKRQEKEADIPPFTEEEAANLFAEITGLDRKFEQTRKEYMASLKSTISEVLQMIDPVTASAQLFAANDMASFGQAFENAHRQNPQISMEAYKKFSKAVDDQVTKLATDSKFVDELKKKSGGKEFSPQDIKASAQTTAFQAAKTQFDKDLAKKLKQVVDSVGSSIKDMKIDDETFKEMQKSAYPEVKEVAGLYEKLLKSYNNIKSDFESKAKSKV